MVGAKGHAHDARPINAHTHTEERPGQQVPLLAYRGGGARGSAWPGDPPTPTKKRLSQKGPARHRLTRAAPPSSLPP